MAQSDDSDALSKDRSGQNGESCSLSETVDDSSSNNRLDGELEEDEVEDYGAPRHVSKSITISMAGLIVETQNGAGDLGLIYTEEGGDVLSDGSSDDGDNNQRNNCIRQTILVEIPPPESAQAQHHHHHHHHHHPTGIEQIEVIEVDEEEDENAKLINCYKKTALTLVLVIFIAFVIVDAATSQYIKTAISSFFEWMENNPRQGFFAFVMVAFTSTMLFIPGILLAIGAGFAFSSAFGLGVGILVGTLAVFLGFTAGAIVSFLLGRFLLRDCVSGLTKKFPLLEALDNAFEEKGFRIMVLLRLSPLIYAAPALNYGAGGTSIYFWDYTLAMVAIIPCTVFFVFLGASAGSLAGGDDDEGSEDDSSGTSKSVMIIGIVVSVIAAAGTSYYAKVELDKVAAASKQEEEGEEDEEVQNDEDGAGNHGSTHPDDDV
jgi:uncharacterized membrane protein YdjX (TVP38/TMEM64 family)